MRTRRMRTRRMRTSRMRTRRKRKRKRRRNRRRIEGEGNVKSVERGCRGRTRRGNRVLMR